MTVLALAAFLFGYCTPHGLIVMVVAFAILYVSCQDID